jgi:hypothetical protein
VDALAALVRGLIVHGDRLVPGQVGADRRRDEPQLRRVSTMLERIRQLDSRPSTSGRPPEHRLVGHCRSTSVLLCGLLREHGVAARARCGFSVYYAEGREFYGDHWVTEYRQGISSRWRLVDAELDAATCARHGIGFDPLDVPRSQLLVAGDAWQRGRDHGRWEWYGRDPQTTGQRYVAGQLLRDAACLRSQEVGAFDNWLPSEPDDALVAVLDDLARASLGEAPGDDIGRLWADHPWLRPPEPALADG